MTTRIAIAVAALLLSGLLGWEWRDRSADIEAAEARAKAERVVAEYAKAEAYLQAKYRRAEQQIAQGQSKAGDDAEGRNAQIQSDYERRIAGAESANRRLHNRWQAAIATCELSRDSAIASAVAEQDRLRRESAERIVRDVRLAQSERDEAVDRYVALQEAYEAMRRPAP